ncbi:HNH endonuclease [Pyruvatibacter sp.]|uniref:HNH endonuclease n=1 Tax=Pyruvatibacter sp. TaxID=1981328 RepID=UPI00326369CA
MAPTCIFCPTVLSERTKPEHILLNALGGRRTTRTAICDHCNNLFGSTIDDDLAKMVLPIRNMLGMRSGKGKKAPSISTVDASGRRLVLMHGGQPKNADKPYSVDIESSGARNIKVYADPDRDLEAIIPHIAAEAGYTTEEIRQHLANAEARLVSQPVDTVHGRLSFGKIGSQRAMMKACLILWSEKVGNAELQKSNYQSAKDFVLSGSSPERGESDHEGLHICQLDTRKLPNNTPLAEEYGPCFNSIFVGSNESGRVVGFYSVHNAIGWWFVLAESGGPPKLKIAIASNPLDPKVHSVDGGTSFEVNWIESAKAETAEVRERIISIHQTYQEKARSSELEKIINGSLKNHGIKEGDLITEAVLHEISHRAVHLLLRMPSERPLTKEELHHLLGKKND